MNKKLEEYCLNNGLEVKGNYAYGNMKGYEFNFFYNAMSSNAPVSFYISFYTDNNAKIKILEEIKSLKIRYLIYKMDNFGIMFGLNDFTAGALMKKLDGIIDNIVTVLNDNNVKKEEYCPLCGEDHDETSKVGKLNDCNFKLHSRCIEELNVAIEEENQEFDEMPNNYLKGFLGALIGSVAGVASFVVLYFLGFISAISAFLSIWLGSLLYTKFGGKQNIMMIIMTFVLTIVSLLLTVWLMYMLAAVGIVVADTGIAVSGIDAFKIMMTDSGFIGAFASDMIMTVIFTLLGVGYEFFAMLKKVKRTSKVK